MLHKKESVFWDMFSIIKTHVFISCKPCIILNLINTLTTLTLFTHFISQKKKKKFQIERKFG
jgi:hypothetical protein